ncbi:MAG: carbohydrate binding domain-containing protein [Thermodesulfobacteriota bacterium]
MANWEKIKFFYKTMLGGAGSSFSASSTLSGTDVNNIYNMLEVNRWEATGTATQIISYDAGHGQLTNGDFEAGDTTGWGLATGGGAAATFAAQTTYTYEGGYAGRVTITAPGSQGLHVNIYQTGKSIVKGRKYAVIFAAQTPSSNKTIVIDMVKTSNPYIDYTDEGPQSIAVTSTMTVFKYIFTANTTADDVAVRWLLGGNTVDFIIDYATFGEEQNYAADYLAIAGHNLGTGTAQVQLQYSDDGASWVGALDTYPPNNKIFLEEFTSPGLYRHWRVNILNAAVNPYMYVCIWGLKTELDYATASYDPHGQEVRADMNLSHGGYLTGIHTRYMERQMTLTFHGAGPSLYASVDAWWETSGLKNFFVGWERANNPDDVFLMRPGAKSYNPFNAGGLYRDVTIKLSGRKE